MPRFPQGRKRHFMRVAHKVLNILSFTKIEVAVHLRS